MFDKPSRLRQALTPIALAILSLVAAVALWVVVTDVENPTTDREFPVTIPIEVVGVPQGLAVLSLSPDAVVVTVRATDEGFEALTAAMFRATVDLTAVRDTETTQNIVVGIASDEEDVSIVDLSTRFTQVVLEPEARKTVPVRVNRLGSLAQGFAVTTTEVNPPEVTVIGPQSSINLVETADVDINLSGVRANIQQRYELTPRDGGGAVQPRVRVEPDSAEARLTVAQQETPQLMPVIPLVQGGVAAGYNVVDIAVDPPFIQVTGSLDILQGLDGLRTATVDIAGATTSITRSVALQAPPGVQVLRQNVTVTVQIEPAPGTRAITVAPVVQNVPPDLVAIIQTTSLTVRVSGLTPLLNELTAGSIQVTVDATGLAEGVHALDARVVVPPNVFLDAFEPHQVVIALRPP